MRKALLAVVLGYALSFVAPTEAQPPQRSLPSNGERARLGDTQPLPEVKVGGRIMRLAPGGQIYDQHNRSIVHGQLPPHSDVLYTKDLHGQLQRIYILTAQEQERLDQARKR